MPYEWAWMGRTLRTWFSRQNYWLGKHCIFQSNHESVARQWLIVSVLLYSDHSKYCSTKWWLLFAEAASWPYLGEIQDYVVLALHELSIRCPIMDCARIGQCLWLTSASSATFVLLLTKLCHHIVLLDSSIFSFVRTAYSTPFWWQPISHWTKAIPGQKKEAWTLP